MAKYLTKEAKPLIVELVGLPGAGKTTISQQLALKLREQNLEIVSRDKILKKWNQENIWQKTVQLLPDNLNYWTILSNSLTFALQVKPINQQSLSKSIKIFTNVKRNDRVARTSDCDIILLDQGLLQEIWSVSITGNPPPTKYLKQELRSLFDSRPMVIVYCQIDVNTALKRIQNRQTQSSRFDQMNSQRAYSVMEKYASYLEEIINCTRTFNIPILELDSSQEINLQSEKFLSWISKLNLGILDGREVTQNNY